MSLAFTLMRVLTLAGVSAGLGASLSSAAYAEQSYEFTYSGRLVNESTGRPVEGPVSLAIAFYHLPAGGSPLLIVTEGMAQVALQEGIFQVTLNIGAYDYQRIFSRVEQPVFVEITDLTHSPDTPYERQQVSMVPYAGKVPVDGTTITFNDVGQLSIIPQPLNTGTGPGNLVALDDNAKLPTVDGSQLTNVQAATVGGATAASVATATQSVQNATSEATPNTLVMRDASGGFAGATVSATTLSLVSGQYTVNLVAPPSADLTSSVTYTLPTVPIGGKFLSTDASGKLIWDMPRDVAAATVPSSGILGTTPKAVPFGGASGGLT